MQEEERRIVVVLLSIIAIVLAGFIAANLNTQKHKLDTIEMEYTLK